MATIQGDENGVLETCDDLTAACETGHTVGVTGTYTGLVTP